MPTPDASSVPRDAGRVSETGGHDSRDAIRSLTASDFDGWVRLWNGYLDFYREVLDEATTRTTFDRLCVGTDLFGLVAEHAGSLVGLAHGILHPTTWSSAPTCYLEDLFVDPSRRGAGTSRLLIEELAAEARRRGAAKVYWHTQEFNAPARSLYDVVAVRLSFVVYERNLT